MIAFWDSSDKKHSSKIFAFFVFWYEKKGATNTTNSIRTHATGVRFSSYQFGATRSYAMNCQPATPSVLGNLTGMCFCSNARVQSSWDNVKKSENTTQTIC